MECDGVCTAHRQFLFLTPFLTNWNAYAIERAVGIIYVCQLDECARNVPVTAWMGCWWPLKREIRVFLSIPVYDTHTNTKPTNAQLFRCIWTTSSNHKWLQIVAQSFLCFLLTTEFSVDYCFIAKKLRQKNRARNCIHCENCWTKTRLNSDVWTTRHTTLMLDYDFCCSRCHPCL